MATVLTSLLSISSALSKGIVYTIHKQTQKVAQNIDIDPASLPESGQTDWIDIAVWGFCLLVIVYIVYEVIKKSKEED